MSENKSENKPENGSEKASENASGKASENTSESAPVSASEDMSEFMIEDDMTETDIEIRERNRNTVMEAMDFIIPFACAMMFLVAGLQLVRTNRAYKMAEREYTVLAEEFVDNHAAVDVIAEPVYYDAGADRESRPHFLNLGVDFAALEAKNEDVVGWVYVPTLQVSYPVVQGEDNEHYLHYTYEGTNNSSGSIFLDCDSKADMTDRNTFVYGHNMRNKSMFGSLKLFREDPTLVDANPYVYYYTKDHAYKYKIFAYYITQVGSEAYYNFKSDAEYDEYVSKIAYRTEYYKWDEADFTGRKNILTLSTCSGQHSKNRMVTHCILIDDYATETS